MKDPQQRDILIAQLSELGFDGFEEISGKLKAYSTLGDPETIPAAHQLLQAAALTYEVKEIAPQNWNALWEANYEPVCVGTFCRIRAHFHPADKAFTHEICITPKMSFGTGHHATTRQMIQMMEKLSFNGKKVLDFGTGTGVLAILAERLGATSVLALENDPDSAENAKDNTAQNACEQVRVAEGSLEYVGDEIFDIVLANINRNVLMNYAAALAAATATKGQLLLSGILREDESLLKDTFSNEGFDFKEAIHEGNWACLRFLKNNNNLNLNAGQS